MTTRALLLFVLALAGCPREPQDPPPPTPVPPPAPDACGPACERFREFGCPEGQPTPQGAPCEEFCRNAEESGAITLNPLCVLGSQTCDEARRCIK